MNPNPCSQMFATIFETYLYIRSVCKSLSVDNIVMWSPNCPHPLTPTAVCSVMLLCLDWTTSFLQRVLKRDEGEEGPPCVMLRKSGFCVLYMFRWGVIVVAFHHTVQSGNLILTYLCHPECRHSLSHRGRERRISHMRQIPLLTGITYSLSN